MGHAIYRLKEVKDLLNDCLQKGIDTESLGHAGDQRSWMVQQLLQKERMACWVKRGFPADRLQSYQSAEILIGWFLTFDDMNSVSLREELDGLNIPCIGME